ncbi:enoyl-CoA hydratase/isomerase family protein [Halomonas dongshanensis]|uniref:Enoyl-CoA hydratase/isomerase family protein n=1 Tax=Halomonas dongshanensis TaxID=2890835 RepID=A0ABT2EAZ0_9GAMM|nr:enoyl-CoA hydratase/isomerase family protein [Halomonas dongshanensis]MCS2608743.1 enoyl-CoA hydratase/isomerase family protein [Halomonas dongshanensis]
MQHEHLNIDTQGTVRILTLTGKPKRGNPLTQALASDLLAAVLDAENDSTIHAIVIAGTPTHFSVGADLNEVRQLSGVSAVLADWLQEFDRIAEARKPTIAAVRGYAMGGGFELALTCDLMVVAEDAQLALPETGVGVIAGQGGTQRILQRAGRSYASDLILTGRVLDGIEAVQAGIAARVCPTDQVVETAIAVAHDIAKRSPAAIRFAREVLHEASDNPIRQSLKMERLYASLVLDTSECRERIDAFFSRKS